MTKDKIVVEEIALDDKPFVSKLMSDSLIEEYGDPPTPEYIDNLLNYYYTKEFSIIYVLKVNNVFAGFIWLIESNDVVVGTSFYCVFYIAVEKEFRGKKLSKLLMDKAITHCKEHNVRQLRLTVRYNNIPALNLYEENGFKVYKHEMSLDF